MKKKSPKKNEPDEVDLLDDMLTALVEVLEEKDLITQEEWEQKIKDKIEKKNSLRPFDKL